MNDHSSLLILGGAVVVLAPLVLIGIGIASDYLCGKKRFSELVIVTVNRAN